MKILLKCSLNTESPSEKLPPRGCNAMSVTGCQCCIVFLCSVFLTRLLCQAGDKSRNCIIATLAFHLFWTSPAVCLEYRPDRRLLHVPAVSVSRCCHFIYRVDIYKYLHRGGTSVDIRYEECTTPDHHRVDWSITVVAVLTKLLNRYHTFQARVDTEASENPSLASNSQHYDISISDIISHVLAVAQVKRRDGRD